MVDKLLNKAINFNNKIRHFFARPIDFIKTGPIFDLIIFDDIFPNPMSDWRLNEFLFYLKHFHSVKIFTGKVINKDIKLPKDYNKHVEELFSTFTIDVKLHSIQPLTNKNEVNARLVYFLFFHNLKWVFPILEKLEIPFAFTLYPGGGFALFNERVKQDLVFYIKSPLCKHVFVNMPNVYEFLTNELGINKEKISYHFSGPIEVSSKKIEIGQGNYSGERLNVCFAAHKYINNGLNKGFDAFCELAKRLEECLEIEFYVIGNFNTIDNIYGPVPNVKYLGEKDAKLLSDIFKNMHIVVSPVRSHVIHPGNFDGFPTGAALNAILNGCVLVTTDPHDNAEKLGLINGEDLFLTSDRPSEIEQIVRMLNRDRVLLYNVAKSGYQKFFSLSNFEGHKMEKFIILKNLMSK